MYTEPPHRTRTHAHFSRANTTAHHPHTSSVGTPHWLKAQCSRSNEPRVIHSVSHPSRSVMSLLNVPYRPFPRVLTSPSAQSSRPSVSTPPIARGRRNSPRRPLAGVSLAEWLTQLQTHTGYEPKLANFFSFVNLEHTPINTLTATTISCAQTTPPLFTTSPEVSPNSGASAAASKQQLAQFHRCSDPPVPGNRVHVMCRVVLASRKLGQSWTEICCSNVL